MSRHQVLLSNLAWSAYQSTPGALIKTYGSQGTGVHGEYLRPTTHKEADKVRPDFERNVKEFAERLPASHALWLSDFEFWRADDVTVRMPDPQSYENLDGEWREFNGHLLVNTREAVPYFDDGRAYAWECQVCGKRGHGAIFIGAPRCNRPEEIAVEVWRHPDWSDTDMAASVCDRWVDKATRAGLSFGDWRPADEPAPVVAARFTFHDRWYELPFGEKVQARHIPNNGEMVHALDLQLRDDDTWRQMSFGFYAMVTESGSESFGIWHRESRVATLYYPEGSERQRIEWRGLPPTPDQVVTRLAWEWGPISTVQYSERQYK